MSTVQRPRRIPNANGQILIENWVEERATEYIDHRISPENKTNQSSSQVNVAPTSKKTAHAALLTLNHQAPLDNKTTYRVGYSEFGPFEKKEQGVRRQRLEHELTRQVTNELNARKRDYEEALRQQRLEDANSEYRVKYNKEFESKPPPATQPHDILHEMPVSFWTEHRHATHGVTQLKTFNSPFHRNASFSTPVELSYEGARPHEMEQWPNYSQKSLNDAKIC